LSIEYCDGGESQLVEITQGQVEWEERRVPACIGL
jgi:hypothetical protein